MATNCSIYDFHDEDCESSGAHPVSGCEKVEVEYLAIKGRLQFSTWSISEENNKIYVLLDNKKLDDYFTDSTKFSFGSVVKVTPVGEDYMQFTGSAGAPVMLALSDFSKENNHQSRVLRSNTAVVFCESIMEEIQFYDERLRNCEREREHFMEPLHVPDTCNSIVKRIGASYLGTCNVPVSCLKSPQEGQIREIDPRHVEKIKTACKVSLTNGGNISFPRGVGCVAECCTLDDIRNGLIDVTIVDGNHSTTALKEVSELYPEIETLKYRTMDIYIGLEVVDMKSLALMRNEESVTSKRTTDFEKVSIMREELKKFDNILTADFINHIYGMFNCLCPSNEKEETLRKKKLLPYIKISTMANETWALVEKVESQHPGHNMYIYAPLGRMRTDVGQKLLNKVISGELKLSSFSKDIKNHSPAEKGEETALQMLRGTKQQKDRKQNSGNCENTPPDMQKQLLKKEAEVEKLKQTLKKKEEVFDVEKSKLNETISSLKAQLKENQRIQKDSLLNQKEEREIDEKLLEEHKLEIERLRAEVKEQNDISKRQEKEKEANRKMIENQKIEIERLQRQLKERDSDDALITDDLPFNVGPPRYHSTPFKELESESSTSVSLQGEDTCSYINGIEKKDANKRSLDASNNMNLKRSKRLQEYNEYHIDQRVDAFYKPEKKWYGAKILEVKSAGCVVRYDEDGVVETLRFGNIKPRNTAI